MRKTAVSYPVTALYAWRSPPLFMAPKSPDKEGRHLFRSELARRGNLTLTWTEQVDDAGVGSDSRRASCVVGLAHEQWYMYIGSVVAIVSQAASLRHLIAKPRPRGDRILGSPGRRAVRQTLAQGRHSQQ